LLVGPREARVQALLRWKTSTGGPPNGPLTSMTKPGWATSGYGSETEDWADYHMIIDSTAIDLDTVVNIIVDASTARRRQAALSAQQ
jgi:hypothetical protein